MWHESRRLRADRRKELDSAVLAYLVARGLTRTVKAFEKEVAGVKQGNAGDLEKAWAGQSTV